MLEKLISGKTGSYAAVYVAATALSLASSYSCGSESDGGCKVGTSDGCEKNEICTESCTEVTNDPNSDPCFKCSDYTSNLSSYTKTLNCSTYCSPNKE